MGESTFTLARLDSLVLMASGPRLAFRAALYVCRAAADQEQCRGATSRVFLLRTEPLGSENDVRIPFLADRVHSYCSASVQEWCWP